MFRWVDGKFESNIQKMLIFLKQIYMIFFAVTLKLAASYVVVFIPVGLEPKDTMVDIAVVQLAIVFNGIHN